MSFRTRMVAAVSAVTAVTLGGAFAVVLALFAQAREKRLDEGLSAVAREEARGASENPEFEDDPAVHSEEVGPLTKYGVVYAPGGVVKATTRTARARPPRYEDVRHPPTQCFDFNYGGIDLRAVIVPVPGRPGTLLMLGVPRTDLDGEKTFLARAMLLAFAVAVAWAALVTSWIVRKLTADHRHIAQIARQVAAGDLTARIRSLSRDEELAQLGRDVDAMIDRLGLLLTSQQRFIAHAAHELRSPLTVLYGELQHALRKTRDATSYRETIEEALDSTTRLKQLTEDLLTLARLGGTRDAPDEPVRARDVVRDAVRVVSELATTQDVKLEVTADDLYTLGHVRDLERLVRNLVENAVRHSPQGGKVGISVAREGERVLIAIGDEGPGVAEAERDRIFEPFYRSAKSRAKATQGAGLGLGIAREIARAHGGDVSVQSGDEGKGARFVIALPAVERRPLASDTGRSEPRQAEAVEVLRREREVDR